MVHFGNDHNCLIIRGKTKEGINRQVRFWAERGLVHCEDSLDNSYRALSVRTFLQRVKALNDMMVNSRMSRDTGFDQHLREETQRNVEKATSIAAQAQIQGMPEDASARRDLVRRRPKTVCLTQRKGVL